MIILLFVRTFAVIRATVWGQRAKVEMVSDLSVRVLEYLDGHKTIDTLHLAGLFKVDHQKVVGAVKSLQSLGDVSVAEPVRSV